MVIIDYGAVIKSSNALLDCIIAFCIALKILGIVFLKEKTQKGSHRLDFTS